MNVVPPIVLAVPERPAFESLMNRLVPIWFTVAEEPSDRLMKAVPPTVLAVELPDAPLQKVVPPMRLHEVCPYAADSGKTSARHNRMRRGMARVVE